MPDREYLMYRPSCKNQMADNIIPDLHSQSYNGELAVSVRANVALTLYSYKHVSCSIF